VCEEARARRERGGEGEDEHVVVVDASNTIDVKGNASSDGKGLEDVGDHLG
jgi:hypothetical protein